MKTFYQILGNSLIAGVTNNFVWFALIFWAILETGTVLAPSIISGIYISLTALSGFWFGSIVDHTKKKTAIIFSSLITLILFIIGLVVFIYSPQNSFKEIGSFNFWALVMTLQFGVIAGNIRNIALPTLVTLLVAEDKRDKANGLSGTVMGIAFTITSVGSGLVLAYFGMLGILITAIILTVIAIVHFIFITIPEKDIIHTGEKMLGKIDIRGTITVIATIPGLFALIFFTTFNNFLGGAFMSLLDAYALTLVPVEVWGVLLGVISLGFIAGGMFIAKKGLGKNPLNTLFTINIIMWVVAMTFTLQPWIWLLCIGMFIWMALVPFIEATEQTIIQKVVPYERQGRVFGFAQSVEQAASPITAFIIGPIAHFIFIPFMTTGAGVELIGSWYGVGMGRGIGLVFTIAGSIGLIVTLIAMRSKSYKLLSNKYKE